MHQSYYIRNTNAALSNVSPELQRHVETLKGVLADLPLCVFPNKSRHQKNLSVLQSVHNWYLKMALHEQGWTLEPYVVTGGASQRRADFQVGTDKKKLVVEVEMGNRSQVDNALAKFQYAHTQGQLGLAVLVVPMRRLAVKTDSGLATFETAVDWIALQPTAVVPYPLLVVGLDETDTPTVNFAQSKFVRAQDLSGNGARPVLAHVAWQLVRRMPVEALAPPASEFEWDVAHALAKCLNAHSRQDDTPAALARAPASWRQRFWQKVAALAVRVTQWALTQAQPQGALTPWLGTRPALA